MEARFKRIDSTDDANFIRDALKTLPTSNWKDGLGLVEEQNVVMSIDNQKMAMYGVASTSIIDQIERLFGNFKITEIKRFGSVSQVEFQNGNLTLIEN